MKAATVLVLACLVLPVVHAMTRVSTGDATLDALERWEERETQSLLRRHQQKASVRQHALLNALQQRVSKEQARVESLLAVDSSVHPHVAAAKEEKAAAPAAAADAPVELEVSAAVVQPHAAAGASSGESETMRQARKELMEADSLLETLEEEVSSKATAHLPEVDATMLVPIQPKPRAKKPKQQKKAPEEAPSMVEVMERARVLEQQRAKHSAAAAEQSRSQEQKKGETLLRVDEAMAIKRLHEASRKEASIPQLKVSMAVLQPLEAPPVLMETAATEHAAVAHTTAAAATATATAGVQQKGKAQQKQTQTNAEAAVVDQFNPFDVNHLAVFSHADNVVAAHKSIVPSGEAGVEEDRRQGEGAFKQQDAMLRLFHQLSPHPAGDRSIPELLETSSTVLAHHESAVHAAALKAPVHDPEQAYQFLKSTSTDSVALPPTLRSEDQDDADPTFQAAAQFLDAVANRDHLDPALL